MMISSHGLPHCLPACLPAVRPGCARPRAPVLSHNQCIIGVFTNLLFRRRFVHCAMVFPFIPYYLAFFSKKVSTHKKRADRRLVTHN